MKIVAIFIHLIYSCILLPSLFLQKQMSPVQIIKKLYDLAEEHIFQHYLQALHINKKK